MEETTRIALNEQSITELKRQTKLLFDMGADNSEKLNTLLLMSTDMKKDSEWLKKEVENHIKNSVEHISQICKNENTNIKQTTQLNIQWGFIWFLTVSILGCSVFIVRQALASMN